MKERFCSLIILAPSAPRAFKLHVSRRVFATLGLAFLLSFLTVVSVGYAFHRKVNDRDRTRLEADNNVLKMEATEATARIKTLDAKLAELEDASKRLEELVAQ